MSSEISDLLSKREIFWELQEITKQNPEILKQGTFFDWMCRNYIEAMTVAVRRYDDTDRRSQSLGRILFEIIERPGVIDRKKHVALYRAVPMGNWHGNRSFDHHVGSGRAYLGSRAVRGDLRLLEDSISRVRRFVNKRVAHRARQGAIQKLPTFKELDGALKTIDQLYCKYNLLITANGVNSCFATRQYDWKSVLYKPWIRES